MVNLGKFSKPLAKLIDAVSGGLGTLYEPTRIRQKAKAEKDAMLILAQGDIEKQELAHRAAHRLAFQEMRRQENIESIFNKAATDMPDEVSEDSVDLDWISRFFTECQDVSNEELQKLWGRLLAHEVAAPGGCSRKTLSILQQMSMEDARLFRSFCSFVWQMSDRGFALRFSFDHAGGVWKDALNFDECLELEAIGLLHVGDMIAEDFHNESAISYHQLEHSMAHSKESLIKVQSYPLTRSGLELSRVCDPEPNMDYYREVLDQLWKSEHISISSPIA